MTLTNSLGILALVAAAAWAAADTPPNPALPSIFVAGDSTAADGTPEAIGWGKPVSALSSIPPKVNVVNLARGGRSSRTFVAEGLWEQAARRREEDDFVLIQFGQNDGGEINGERIARGSLPGLGDESPGDRQPPHQAARNRPHLRLVHAQDDRTRRRQKGATPILLSLTVRNIWKDGRRRALLRPVWPVDPRTGRGGGRGVRRPHQPGRRPLRADGRDRGEAALSARSYSTPTTTGADLMRITSSPA